MKIRKRDILKVLLLLLFLSGCQQKRIPNLMIKSVEVVPYQSTNVEITISDESEIGKITELIENIEWQKGNMSAKPSYSFYYQYDANVSAVPKTITYNMLVDKEEEKIKEISSDDIDYTVLNNVVGVELFQLFFAKE